MQITKDTPIQSFEVKRVSETELEILSTKIYSKECLRSLSSVLFHPYHRKNKVESLYSVDTVENLTQTEKMSHIGYIEVEILDTFTSKFKNEWFNVVRLRKTITDVSPDKLDIIEEEHHTLNKTPRIRGYGLDVGGCLYPVGVSLVVLVENEDLVDSGIVGDLVA